MITVEMTEAEHAQYLRAYNAALVYVELEKIVDVKRIDQGVMQRRIESPMQGLEYLALAGAQSYRKALLPEAREEILAAEKEMRRQGLI